MATSRSIQRTYLLLMLGNTLAASLIWGINTIFLLDAGLSNLEAFAANAFFTGAVEAWLVDALKATGYEGRLETVFGRGQIVTGAGMLGGSVAGGFLAQQISLGTPFVLRGVILIVMFVVAFRLMHDVGFTPEKGGRP